MRFVRLLERPCEARAAVLPVGRRNRAMHLLRRRARNGQPNATGRPSHQGCLACQQLGRCVIDDDANAIARKMEAAEVIVFATPIYYYEMCGQMKTLLDRLNPLYKSDYKFRDIYMLATAADDDAHAIDKAYNGLQGWVDCFEKAELKGYVFGNGIAEPGDAKNHTETLLDAYNLGKSL